MSDLISIKDERFWDILFHEACVEGEQAGRIEKELEQITVEPKRGEWKVGKNHGEFVEAECTSCKGLLLVKWYDEIDKYRYCPNCGARMDGEGYEID